MRRLPFALALIAVIVFVDLVFLRHHGATRLIVNLAIVGVFLVYYFLFIRK